MRETKRQQRRGDEALLQMVRRHQLTEQVLEEVETNGRTEAKEEDYSGQNEERRMLVIVVAAEVEEVVVVEVVEVGEQ